MAKGVEWMNKQLISILEQYADETHEDSEKDRDEQRKAYKAGKAEGLRLAKDLLELVSEYGPYSSLED